MTCHVFREIIQFSFLSVVNYASLFHMATLLPYLYLGRLISPSSQSRLVMLLDAIIKKFVRFEVFAALT